MDKADIYFVIALIAVGVATFIFNWNLPNIIYAPYQFRHSLIYVYLLLILAAVSFYACTREAQ